MTTINRMKAELIRLQTELETAERADNETLAAAYHRRIVAYKRQLLDAFGIIAI